MLYIDRKSRDGKTIRHYFGNTQTYRVALKEQPSDLKLMQLSDSAVDISSNKVLKCRYLLQEIFDSYYENKAFENSVIRE